MPDLQGLLNDIFDSENNALRVSSSASSGIPADVTSSAATDDLINSDVTGDSVDRFVLNADGKLEWGPGNAALDVNLYRAAANQLATDDVLVGPNGAAGTPTFSFGSDPDTGMYRRGSNDLGFAAGGSLVLNIDVTAASLVPPLVLNGTGGSGHLELREQASDPSAPTADRGRLFLKDNGAGKSQLCIRFNTGAVQVLATEP